MQYLTSALFFLIVAHMAVLCGYGLLSRLKLSFGSAEEKLAFGFSIGFGLLGYAVLLLGMIHCLYAPLLVVLYAGCVIVLRKELPIFHKECRESLNSFLFSKLPLFFDAVRLVLAACFVLSFLAALAPSFSNDSMVYHLTDAKFFASRHYVGLIPFNSANALWPYLVEMYYTLALIFQMPNAATLFHFALAAVTALAVYAFIKRFFQQQAAYLSAALFFITPGIFMETSQTYVDLGLVLYGFLSVYSVMVWLSTGKGAFIGLAGAFCGLAVSVKYFGVVIPLLLGIYLLWKKPRAFLLFILVTFLASFVWYLRQYLVLGNPVFPFFSKIFGASGLDREVLDSLSEKTIRTAFGMGAGFMNVLTVAWRVTMHPRQFGGEQIGLLFLAVIPAILLLRPREPFIRKIGAFALAYCICWFFLYQNLRFLLPVVPFLSILAAYVVVKFAQNQGRYARWVYIVIALFLSLQFALCIRHSLSPLKTVLGFEKGSHYLASNERSYEISEYINRSFGQQANILVVDEGHTFFLDTPHRRELYYWIYNRYDKRSIDVSRIVSYFRSEGFSHILYASVPGDTDRSGTALRLTQLMRDDGFKSKFLKEIYVFRPSSKNANGVTYYVYAINP
jgi:hypothetical protein